MSKSMKSTRNNEWLKMYPEVPYEVTLSHLESHPEKLDKEKSTIEYDILAAALRYFPTLVLLLNEDVIQWNLVIVNLVLSPTFFY